MLKLEGVSYKLCLWQEGLMRPGKVNLEILKNHYFPRILCICSWNTWSRYYLLVCPYGKASNICLLLEEFFLSMTDTLMQNVRICMLVLYVSWSNRGAGCLTSEPVSTWHWTMQIDCSIMRAAQLKYCSYIWINEIQKYVIYT